MNARNVITGLLLWVGVAVVMLAVRPVGSIAAQATVECPAVDSRPPGKGEADRDDVEPPVRPTEEPRGESAERQDRRGRGRHHAREGEARRGGRGKGTPGGSPDRAWPRQRVRLEEVLNVIREKLPEFHKQLQTLKQKNPDKWQRTMEKIGPVVQEYMRLREHDEEMADTLFDEFKIEEALKKLSRQYAKAEHDPERQAALEEQITTLVERQFELRFKRQKFRLEMFQKRLEQQRTRLEEQRKRLQEEAEQRDDHVARRVEQVKQGKMKEHRARHRGPRRHGIDGEPRGKRMRGPRGEGRGLRHRFGDDDRPPMPPDDRPDRRPPPEEDPDGPPPSPPDRESEAPSS